MSAFQGCQLGADSLATCQTDSGHTMASERRLSGAPVTCRNSDEFG